MQKGMGTVKNTELITTMKANGNADRAMQMKAYMRNQFEFLGIPAGVRKELAKPFMKEAKRTAGVDWDLLRQLWEEPWREFQYIGCGYLLMKHEELTAGDLEKIRELALIKPWWDTIDSIDRPIDQIGRRDPDAKRILLQWSESDSIWLRRIAIIHQRTRKEDTDVELLEKAIGANLGDSEFFINKAIGWSLRAYSKTDPEWVGDFIGGYGQELNPLSIREGSKYL